MREMIWDPIRGVYLRREEKSDETFSASGRFSGEAAAPDGAMAAESSAAGAGNAQGAAAEPGGAASQGKLPERPDGGRGAVDSSSGSHGGNDGSANAGDHGGETPGVVFDEDRPIRVDFDDMIDLAKRTRVSGDAGKS